MDKILGVIGGIPVTTNRNDDDFSDRLLYRYTTAIFILFAVIVSTKQYVGEPIQCWVPAHFSGNHEEYTNNYCWVRNTYYLPNEQNVPKEGEYEKRKVIPYYQWMPMILALQALICYLPILCWRSFNNKSGIDVNNIVEAGEKFSTADAADSREKSLMQMTKLMDRYLSNQRDTAIGCTLSLKHIFSRTCFRACGRRHGNYLVTLYLFIKIISIVSIVSQLFMLNLFLGQDFHLYGIDVLRGITTDADFTSSRFPRVTMCDFKVRRLGNVQRYTVQCVLPINLFNEKIYLFVWFWLAFVAAMSVLALITWALRAIFKVDRHRYIKKHLYLMDKLQRESDKKQAVKFVEEYLRQDGVFVLRLVGHNTNAIAVTEFVCQLWDNWRSKSLTDRIEGKDGKDLNNSV